MSRARSRERLALHGGRPVRSRPWPQWPFFEEYAVEVARATGADMLVVAVRDLGPPALQDVTRAAAEAGLGLKILPPLSRLLDPSFQPVAASDLDVII